MRWDWGEQSWAGSVLGAGDVWQWWCRGLKQGFKADFGLTLAVGEVFPGTFNTSPSLRWWSSALEEVFGDSSSVFKEIYGDLFSALKEIFGNPSVCDLEGKQKGPQGAESEPWCCNHMENQTSTFPKLLGTSITSPSLRWWTKIFSSGADLQLLRKFLEIQF